MIFEKQITHNGILFQIVVQAAENKNSLEWIYNLYKMENKRWVPILQEEHRTEDAPMNLEGIPVSYGYSYCWSKINFPKSEIISFMRECWLTLIPENPKQI